MSLLMSPSPARIAANQGKPGLDSGFAVRGRTLRGQSIDSTMVVGQVAQPNKPRHAELKGLPPFFAKTRKNMA